MRRRQGGFAVTWLVVLLPVLIGILGLVLDGTLLFLRSQMLDAATDAAALAATGAWDRDRWLWEREVRIDPAEAERRARAYLHKNMPGARLVDVKVNSANQVTIRTEATVPFFFLRIVGWESRTVASSSSAVRRGSN